MRFETFHPGLPLSRYVEQFWAITSNGTPAPPQRVFPQGAMAFVINLADRKLSFSFDDNKTEHVGVPLLAGPYSKPFLVDPAEYTHVLGVRFKPGRARLFFGVPAHELHNVDVPLEDLYPREGERLRQQLLSAGSLPEQFRTLESYLTKRLSTKASVHPAIEYAAHQFTQSFGPGTVANVEHQVGLSHTRFIHLFRESVGVTPNLFSRLQRFQSVLRHVQSGQPVRWAELAISCGYYDQAHLIRDFRQFSGLTPGAYVRLVQGTPPLAKPQPGCAT